ncbi:MAG: hypothetical protein C0P64_008285 [Bacillota bacterium]
MKWGAVAGLTVLVAAMALYEWPKIDAHRKNERRTFVVLTALGWLLSVLLLFWPELPGPRQLVEWVFHPVVRGLERIGIGK